MKKTILQMLAALSLVSGMAAQEPYSETVEVRVVNVDVIVTDKKGNPVEGLEPEDFVIYEGGKEQALTNFYEVRGSRRTPDDVSISTTEPAADPRIRRIALLFDNQSMVPTTRNAMIGRIREFLPRIKRPNDEVIIASIYNGLKIDLQFTRDMDAVMNALKLMEGAPVNGLRMQQARRDAERELRDLPENYSLQGRLKPDGTRVSGQAPYVDAINAAQQYANIVKHSVTQSTDAATSFFASLSGMDGRKIVLLATESIPTYAGREVFEYLDAMKTEFSGGSGRQPVSENLNLYDTNSLVIRLASVANDSGLTLYPIHVGGPTHILRTADESNDDSLNYRTNTSFKGAAVARSLNNTSVLPYLAAETGGVALVESTNFDLILERVEDDLASYYSLGYRPSREASNTSRRIDVKLRTDSGYVIRHRTGMTERTQEAAQDAAVTAALSHDAQKNDLGIRLQPLETTALDGGASKVPVKIIIPMDALTLLPDGEDLTGKISIFVRFARTDGVMSEVSRRTNDFRFPASTRSRRKELTIQTDFTVEPDVQRVSVGVVDELSQATGFATYDPPGANR